MEDEVKDPQNGAPSPTPAGGAEFTLEDVFSKFKAEDILGNEAMAKALQSHTDSTVTKALTTAKAKWEKEQLLELDESKKLEKMTAAQREKYQLDKDRAELEKQKAAFEHSQLEVSVGAELQKRNLPSEFSEFLTADNAENSKTRIDSFEKAFNAAVSAALDNRLRSGTLPLEQQPHTGTFTKEQLSKMTVDEINANWDAVSKSL